MIYFSPPLIVSGAEVDRMVAITRDAVKAALGA
jgi:adenosylmethionine-8-amino-7-oxononanoate aminotransferase